MGPLTNPGQQCGHLYAAALPQTAAPHHSTHAAARPATAHKGLAPQLQQLQTLLLLRTAALLVLMLVSRHRQLLYVRPSAAGTSFAAAHLKTLRVPSDCGQRRAPHLLLLRHALLPTAPLLCAAVSGWLLLLLQLLPPLLELWWVLSQGLWMNLLRRMGAAGTAGYRMCRAGFVSSRIHALLVYQAGFSNSGHRESSDWMHYIIKHGCQQQNQPTCII
jgi:hypothetical protein